ncbi:hypothetical protein [Chromobacterium haemolyticum]|uniref:hypothetical protein n=1 Tax=Chromobacterium haemolyticum TaxID=394935 RepID=UPI0029534EE4|nr:hypothetical protein [Chromobacterium haemolyticum]WON85808.1 hypothetical protein OK026_10080 [Chromobacterium haemolyticum]
MQTRARNKTVCCHKRKLSKELFYLLANDAESTVRQAIAANKKAPIDILNFLINDDNEDVASVAKYNIQNRQPHTKRK